jgi:hypothetical protein
VLDALLFPEHDQDRSISRTLERMVVRQALDLSGPAREKMQRRKIKPKTLNISEHRPRALFGMAMAVASRETRNRLAARFIFAEGSHLLELQMRWSIDMTDGRR